MQISKTSTKPSIMIGLAVYPENEQKLREVQAGIEEEGIPYTLLQSDEADAVKLAYQGAAQSQLGVGIGIGLSAVCVHYVKLPADRPLFISDETGSRSEWRRCGYNAARLVKGIPFKTPQSELPEADLPEAESSKQEPDPELYQFIRELVIKVVHEHAQAMGR